MREVIIARYCDVCNGEGVRAEATGPNEWVIGEETAPRATKRGKYEFCEPCQKSVTVFDLIGLIGFRLAQEAPARAEGAPAVWPCMVCDGQFTQAGGITSHMRDVHGMADARLMTQVANCPQCGEALTGTTSAFRGHVVKKHGGESVWPILKHAQLTGDPFGVVAERLKACGWTG